VITESTRKEVGQRFDNTEAHDEGEDRRSGSQAERALPKQRHDAAFKSHHTADESIDDH